jgi:galactitol-specific phosphotransferase system IIB component
MTMAKRSFFVRAVWDPELKRYFSESDIWGLNIETSSIEEFEEVMNDVAADLIVANHLTAEELASTPVQDLIPTIVWERPAPVAA